MSANPTGGTLVVKTAGSRARRRRLVSVALSLMLVAAACGGGGDDNTSGTSGGGGGGDGGAGDKPVAGGKLVYGQEAEDSGGLCLPEAQLDISGINYARVIYDTLTQPNEDGEFVPYLAKSITHNDTFDTWTIDLREGIKFHDGSDLTAEVVKNNIDAYRGAYPNRKPLLFTFEFSGVKDVTVTGPLQVTVTTKTPWSAFPAHLFSSGRVGIMAQAQLDDASTCGTKLIGTGPFTLKEWAVNDHFTAVKNPNYWLKDADGNTLPYLDEIEFRPIIEGQQRANSLQSAQIQAMHTSDPLIIDQLRDLADSGNITNNESDQFPEVNYVLLNAAKEPFNNIHARLAAQYAFDRDTYNQVRNKGILTNASGPFGPGAVGYLEDSGVPEFNLDKAKEEVAKYKEETGKDLEFALGSTPDPSAVADQQLAAQFFQAAGMKVSLTQTEQTQYINDAIGKNYQAQGWRNHPGSDPDAQYVWWHCGNAPPTPCDNLVNFSGFNDEVINKDLDDGRAEGDPEKRKALYEDVNRQFAKQLYNLWTNWTVWAVGTSPKVHGVIGPDLPDGSKQNPGFGTGNPMSGLFVTP